jgi:cellobiose-specific phosphotransferase system component IIB
VPLPDPCEPLPESATPQQQPLLVCSVGVSELLLEQAIRSRRLPVQAVESVEEADVVLALRQQLGQQPELRRQAQQAGVPILVIKSDSLSQVQRGLERLLQRHESPEEQQAPAAPMNHGADDDLAALEECRLAVEQLVLAKGQPVELLPRSERVRRLQAELAAHYQLASAEFGSGRQQRLRIFPR